jgi:hypothetical protein
MDNAASTTSLSPGSPLPSDHAPAASACLAHLYHLCFAECWFKHACLYIVHHAPLHQVQPVLGQVLLVRLALSCMMEGAELGHEFSGILQ